MSTLLQDLRYALRTLRAQPAFTIVAVLTLALGIGANTAIFGIVNGVLLKPLPYGQPDRVVMLWSHWINWNKTWLSPPELDDYQREAHTLQHVARVPIHSFNLTGTGEPLRVRAAQVQPAVFSALGAVPIAGRLFTAEEDRAGHDHVVVLGEGVWRAQFGGDPSIFGKTIALDGARTPSSGCSCVAAAADRLRDPRLHQLWVPLALGPDDPTSAATTDCSRSPGCAWGGVATAQAEMNTITCEL